MKYVLSLLFIGLVASCSDASDATAGARVTLRTRIDGMPEAAAPFVNAKGWSVTLSEAKVSAGPFYYFDGSVLLAHRSPSGRDRLLEALGIRSAWAHPGHYIAGAARGEMLTPINDIDLRSGVVALPPGAGVTGTVRSATFTFGESDLTRDVIRLAGVATKGLTQRGFTVKVKQGDMLNASGNARVEGCPFVETNVTQGGVVSVHVALPVWFDQVEFQELPESSAQVPVAITAEMVAHNALVRGIKASDGYLFKFTKDMP